MRLYSSLGNAVTVATAKSFRWSLLQQHSSWPAKLWGTVCNPFACVSKFNLGVKSNTGIIITKGMNPIQKNQALGTLIQGKH